MEVMKWWFYLTQWYPRRLPTTVEEYERLKQVLIQYFGLKDDPNTWTMLPGQITSVQPHSVRRSYRKIANAIKRLDINYLAHTQKQLAIKDMEAKLEEARLKVVDEKDGQEQADTAMSGGALDLPEQLQEVPRPAPGVV